MPGELPLLILLFIFLKFMLASEREVSFFPPLWSQLLFKDEKCLSKSIREGLLEILWHRCSVQPTWNAQMASAVVTFRVEMENWWQLMNDFNFTTEVVALQPDEVIDLFVLLTCNFKTPFSPSSAPFKCPLLTLWLLFPHSLTIAYLWIWALIYTYLFSNFLPSFFFPFLVSQIFCD